MLTGWSKIGKQNRIKHTKHVTDKIYMRCTMHMEYTHIACEHDHIDYMRL